MITSSSEKIRENQREEKARCGIHMTFFEKLENAVCEACRGVFNMKKQI